MNAKSKYLHVMFGWKDFTLMVPVLTKRYFVLATFKETLVSNYNIKSRKTKA